jgi:hypothetical protein
MVQKPENITAYTGPEDASPWVYAGNVLEEQRAELPADCYTSPDPVPKGNNHNNNKQPQSNVLPSAPLTKSQMQDKVYMDWLELAQRRLVQNSPNRRQYLQNKRWLQDVYRFIKTKKEKEGERCMLGKFLFYVLNKSK